MSTSPLRILLVSQMYPGPGHPDLGVFVRSMHEQLEARGHQVRVVAVQRRGGSPLKHVMLGIHTLAAAIRMRPDVIYAHFLAPAGVWAAMASLVVRRPLVVTAHGRDVRNIGAIPGVRLAMRLLARRAATVIAVSDHLRRDLEQRLPEIAGRTEVIDSGIDLAKFAPGDQQQARFDLDWPAGTGPAYVFVGTLDERKNVLRLAEAFERLEVGELAFVGDGPLRVQLLGRERIRVVGRVEHAEVQRWITAADVLCLPSTVEPFGQVLLEAMACERSVVATNIGGPPEFVPPAAGVLVDPVDVDSIEHGLRSAAALPSPNTAARRAAAEHDIVRQSERVEAVLRRAVAGDVSR